MRFVDEFRDPAIALRLVEQIKAASTKRWVLMEVCGGQTHSLLRHGIDQELQDAVELIHGPGCPVCVTDTRAIDLALWLASQPQTVLASFGDMLRVPGSSGSLLTTRAAGGQVMTVYSPLDAVSHASKHPNKQVVFFAVGFETTAPATALAVLQAQKLGLSNFFLLVSHVRVLPAMEALMQSPDNRVQAFLAAGHVCCVTGYAAYDEFAKRYRVPVVVTGFEPVDLLQGILECVTQLESGRAEVSNSYGRSVERDGNRDAQRIIDTVYQIDDRPWRGFGIVDAGGYRLRDGFAAFDAECRFGDLIGQITTSKDSRCRAGDVLSGRLKPCDCPEFGGNCAPDSPLGAPMVSSEGACAAYFRYQPHAV
ncbi:MAG TPA: hydrogenase formation protein HypD [Planctomycetaceae bacterium]|nr:hydrogenase formation protein HypD [Planctomycetaceae bacterium]